MLKIDHKKKNHHSNIITFSFSSCFLHENFVFIVIFKTCSKLTVKKKTVFCTKILFSLPFLKHVQNLPEEKKCYSKHQHFLFLTLFFIFWGDFLLEILLWVYSSHIKVYIVVQTVGYRYKKESSSLGKSLCILVEWYAYINPFECISIGII